MEISQMLYRVHGDKSNCPADGSELTKEQVELEFEDRSRAKYEIMRCGECGRAFLWIATRYYNAIQNYSLSEEYYPTHLRDRNCRFIETLYRVEKHGKECPIDHGHLDAVSIDLRMAEGIIKSYNIKSCKKCQKRYITISKENAKLVTNYIISDQLRVKIATADEAKTKMINQQNNLQKQNREKTPVIQTKVAKIKTESEESFCSRIPSSSILTVSFDGMYQGRDSYTIVKKYNDEDISKGIYYLNRLTAQKILKSVLFNIPFEPKIKSVVRHADYRKYIEKMTYFCDIYSPKTITVYKRKLIIPDSEVEVVTAFILFTGHEEPIPISVYYEPKSGKYYINEVSYQSCMWKYGLPFFHVQPIGNSQQSDWNLRTNSELNLFGYSVSQQSKVTVFQRRKLLEQLIDSGLMSKARIMGHLEWLISTRRRNPSMTLACKAWEDDLDFVSKYQMHNQRVIWGKLIGNSTEIKKHVFSTAWHI